MTSSTSSVAVSSLPDRAERDVGGGTARAVLGAPTRRLMTAAVAMAGAEVCAAALLGVAGWFLATSAAAGLGLVAFSWVAPSAWVRSFALGRTGLRYVGAVRAHAAALERQASVRASVLAGAAEQVRRDGRTFARRWRSEQIQSALTRDLAAVQVAPLRLGLPLVAAATTAVGGVAVLAVIAPFAAVAVLLGVVAHGILLRWASQRDVGTRAEQVAAAEGALSEAATSAADGWPELATFGSVGVARAHLAGAGRRYDAARSELAQRQVRVETLAPLLSRLAVLVAVAVAASGAAGARVPMRVATALLAVAVLEVTGGVPGPWVDFARVRRAAIRLRSVGQDAAHDADAVMLLAADRASYIVSGLAPGSSLVVTGRSGVGKTTLLQAIAAGRADALLVADDWAVLDATVAENLRLACADADDACLGMALRVAGLGEIVDNAELWPNGLSTRVGRHGRALSGGERRRLAMAQAVLASPSLLLLDEPTEGLDTASARRALAGVRAALPGAAIVAVVHDRLLDHLPDVAWPQFRLDEPSARSTGALASPPTTART